MSEIKTGRKICGKTGGCLVSEVDGAVAIKVKKMGRKIRRKMERFLEFFKGLIKRVKYIYIITYLKL